MLRINIVNRYDRLRKHQRIVKTIIRAAYKHLNLRENMIVNVVLVGNDEIRELNKTYRKIDAPTDVLSFANTDSLNEIGDIFVSLDKAKLQAKEYGHTPERELAFLTLHGFLHCLGYDHLTNADEDEMTTLQKAIIETTKYKKENEWKNSSNK